MQGVEDEDEGAYWKYVTETGLRKQRSSLKQFNQLHTSIAILFDGLKLY